MLYDGVLPFVHPQFFKKSNGHLQFIFLHYMVLFYWYPPKSVYCFFLYTWLCLFLTVTPLKMPVKWIKFFYCAGTIFDWYPIKMDKFFYIVLVIFCSLIPTLYWWSFFSMLGLCFKMETGTPLICQSIVKCESIFNYILCNFEKLLYFHISRGTNAHIKKNGGTS